MPAEFSAVDNVWVMVSAALVLLMVPGLALFYGGMVRVKSALNMLMMSFVCLPVVTVVWVLFGFSLAFGPDTGGGLIGTLRYAGMAGIGPGHLTGSVPTLTFSAFQLTFAIITAALLSGAVADRARFGPWIVFVALWVTVVYAPIAHWVFGGGWIAEHLRILDLAGGTVVEINSGASGLALALVLGPRLGFRTDPMRPHSLPLVMLGAGLLWFGWFGFNAGSALTAGTGASVAFFNTQVAGAAAVAGWLIVERLRDGHPTSLGAASGAVAGLVAITPSGGAVTPLGALVIGLIAGVVCAYAVGLKYRLRYDDSLDVAGVHGVGGVIGMVLIGVLASATVTGGPSGLLDGGGPGLLGRQALVVVTVAAYAFGVTWLLAKGIDRLIGFRVSAETERSGLDQTVHAETAYELHVTGGRVTHLTGGEPLPRASATAVAERDGQ